MMTYGMYLHDAANASGIASDAGKLNISVEAYTQTGTHCITEIVQLLTHLSLSSL